MNRIFRKPNDFIQLPLFDLGSRKKSEFHVEWKNGKEQYSISCHSPKYGVPSTREQDILNCILFISQEYGENRFCNRDIFDILGKQGELRSWSTNIKKSLQCLSSAEYRFENCLQKEHIITTKLISIQEHRQGRGKYYTFEFPEIITEQLETPGKYQIINLDEYLKLPIGLPRRLYELLQKKRNLYKDNAFSCREETLSRWLAVNGKYPSTRLKNIRKAVNILIEQNILLGTTNVSQYCQFHFPQQTKKKSKHPRKTSQTISNPQYHEAITWILQIAPDFDLRQLQTSDLQELQEYLPELKQKYSQINTESIVNKAGWLFAAIRQKWQAKASEKQQNLEKQQQIREQEYQKFQEQKLKEQEQQNHKEQQQREIKQQFLQNKWQLDSCDLWQEALRKAQNAPITSQNRVAKIYFCEKIAKKIDMDPTLLDFQLCDFIVEQLIEKQQCHA